MDLVTFPGVFVYDFNAARTEGVVVIKDFFKESSPVTEIHHGGVN